MSSESRKKILVYLMAFTMLLTIPAVYIRLSFCVEEAPPPVLETITGSYGTMTDRNGTKIYDRKGCTFDEFYNIIDGILSNGNTDSTYTLAYKFGHELAAQTISLLSGYSLDAVKVDGSNLATTLLPGEALVTLREAFGEYDGTIFAYNYKTGEILCAITTPTYDPDDVPDIAADDSGAYDGVYLNRFIQSAYIPGSIFKVVTTAAALDSVKDILDRTFTCDGVYEYGIDRVTCQKAHGTLALKQALAKSCNCSFAQIANLVGKENLQKYADQFQVTAPISFA